ncbi:MAG TPA: hypothetical protein VFB73_05850 [Chloroflexota bacterium]|nr:hypothetical protein [Chloroflexota bacterium]
MAERPRTLVAVEEYVERRVESATGRVVVRRYRRAWWAQEPENSTARQVVETAMPLLRSLAIAMAPALGRLALRALAPRLRAALPAPQRYRPVAPRALGGGSQPARHPLLRPLPSPIRKSLTTSQGSAE